MIIENRELTLAGLNQGEFQDVLSELYELKAVIENSTWHIHQSVFDHILAVYGSLENLLSENSPLNNPFILQVIHKNLEQPLGNQKRINILLVATLLHDNAKDLTLITDKNGIARCPGHELIGATRVWEYQSRFGFDDISMEAVERIVRYHGLISEILNLALATKDYEKYYRIFTNTVGNVEKESILLMYSDLLGSDLKKSDEKAFNDRLEVLNRFVSWSFSAD